MNAKDDAAALIKKHAKLVNVRPGEACHVEGSGKRGLIEALLASNVNAAAVARILKAEGIRVSYDSLQRHRKQDCACQR